MISGNFEIFLRQHRTKLVRRLRRQIFRQIVQGRRRRADARQGELVQDDGKYASKMRAKREARALCGVALILSLMIILLSLPSAYAANVLTQSDFVHEQGKNVIGTDGERLLIKGMALENSLFINPTDPNPKHHTQSTFEELSGLGFDCVRFVPFLFCVDRLARRRFYQYQLEVEYWL